MPRTARLSAHFKGDRPPETDESLRLLNEKLITGSDPVSGKKIDRAEYLRLLRRAKAHNRELTEVIGRTVAANVHGALLKRRSDIVPSFTYGEGCSWGWGQNERFGAEICRDVHTAIPDSLQEGFPDPDIQKISNRTRGECEVIFSAAREAGDKRIDVVTHDYHAPRTRRIARETLADMRMEDVEFNVLTPSRIATNAKAYLEEGAEGRDESDFDRDMRFACDVIDACEPTPATKLKEAVMETCVYWPIHLASRGLQKVSRWFGYDFDLEGWIADRKRADAMR